MRRYSYSLPALPVSRQSEDGIVNQGFKSDDLSRFNNSPDTNDSSTDQSNCQVSKYEDGKDPCPVDIEDDGDTYCGIGSCRPKSIQCCKNMAWFTALYSIIGLVMAALSSYTSSQITSLEKHFNMNSSISGFLMACDDLGFLSATLLVSYYTRRAHIPRVLSLCSIFYGISGIFCAVPFFGTRDQIPSPPLDTRAAGNSSASTAQTGFTQMCQNFSTPANLTCTAASIRSKGILQITEDWRIAAIVIIAVGMILQGVTKSPRQAFLSVYVDDNVPKTKTSLYLGITAGITLFGPGLAYGLGGVFSSIYITLEETSMSPRDPRWISAWWLGFLVIGGAALIVSLPLFFFPKHMHKHKRSRPIQQHVKPGKTGCYRLWLDCKDLLKSVLHLAINPVFMCLTFATAFTTLMVSGVMAFLSKYLETQFTIPASKANMLIGCVTFTSAPLGTIVGGYVTSRFKMSPKTCIKFVLVCSCIDISVSSLWFIFGCDQPKFYTGTHTDRAIHQNTSQCLHDCHCDDQKYFPVCGSDGNTYFSPCNAGCLTMNNQIFTNCSCMDPDSTQTATGGLCQQDCNMLNPYLAVNAVGTFFLTLNFMPVFIATIRSVKEEEKPLAIGVITFMSSLLGWFLGPVIYGALIDSTCKVWKMTCSTAGACSLYDIELFRSRNAALSTGLRGIVIVLFAIALIYALCSKTFVFQPHRDIMSQEVIVDKNQNEDTIINNKVTLSTEISKCNTNV